MSACWRRAAGASCSGFSQGRGDPDGVFCLFFGSSVPSSFFLGGERSFFFCCWSRTELN